MNVAAIIPARGGSKGIPRKNLQQVGGLPLVRWSINAARQAKLIDDVYVSTDDSDIAAVAQHGATVIHRPARLATDRSTTPEAVSHAVESMAVKPDILVVMQCTTPFTTPGDINRAVAMLIEDESADVVATVCEDHGFQLRPYAGGVEWVTTERSGREIRRQDIEPTYKLNGGLFVFRTDAFMRQPDCMFFGTVRTCVMPADRSIDIDTPYDLHVAEATAQYLAGESK